MLKTIFHNISYYYIMKILILNITINWVYRLYEEYINSLEKFINIHYNNINTNNINNINIEIKYINSVDFDINNFNLLLNSDNNIIYDKIFYSGDISIFNTILNKYINSNIIANLNFIDIFYYINIEQLSKNSYYIMLRNIDLNIKIIDYSEENCLYLNNLYKYYLFPPYFKNFNLNHYIKNIDVLCITNNTYRQNIFNNITLNYKFEKISVDNIYGFDRDEFFNKTKIYVNIHSSDEHQTMELIRINNLIMRKVIVVSQNSINKDSLFFKDFIITFDSFDNLNTILNELLENYISYFNKIFNNFHNKEIEYNYYIKSNLDKLIYS